MVAVHNIKSAWGASTFYLDSDWLLLLPLLSPLSSLMNNDDVFNYAPLSATWADMRLVYVYLQSS